MSRLDGMPLATVQVYAVSSEKAMQTVDDDAFDDDDCFDGFVSTLVRASDVLAEADAAAAAAPPAAAPRTGSGAGTAIEHEKTEEEEETGEEEENATTKYHAIFGKDDVEVRLLLTNVSQTASLKMEVRSCDADGDVFAAGDRPLHESVVEPLQSVEVKADEETRTGRCCYGPLVR